MNITKLNISKKPIMNPSQEDCRLFLNAVVSEYDSCGYDSFKAAFKKAKERDVLKNCTQENMLGSGSNCEGVYAFTNPKLKKWVIKKLNISFNDKNRALKQLPDVFAPQNLGQEIARIGDRYTILKRVFGIPLSFQDWAKRKPDYVDITISRKEVEKFIKDLNFIKDLPEESFIKYAEMLKTIDKNGYKADSFNPNNYLLDYKNKRINIIDSYKYEPDMGRNTVYDMFCPLVDYHNYVKYMKGMNEQEKKDFIKNTRIVFEKCVSAAKKVGISTSEKTFTEFIDEAGHRLNTSYLDKFMMMKKIAGIGDCNMSFIKKIVTKIRLKIFHVI